MSQQGQGDNMSLRPRDDAREEIRSFRQGATPTPTPAPTRARTAPRRSSATGWFNRHVDRGRMTTSRLAADARRVSWRRAL